MISSPPFPIDIVPMPNGDLMLLPAVWPVRLTPEQQLRLAEILAERNPRADLPESS